MSKEATPWLASLPKSVQQKIHAMTHQKTNGRETLNGTWSLYQMPSVGPAKYADLRLKTRSGQILETIPVMRDGEPVGRFA